MRRFALVIALVLALPLVAGAQDTKTAQGKISAITGNTVTLSVDGKDMTFTVDAATKVTAPGAGTAAREAQKQGAKGPDFTSLLKAGDNVEVRYREAAGTMQAVAIREIAAVASGPAAKTLRGTVTAVTDTTLTVKEAAGETTFVVDAKTVVEGTGAGTKARTMKAAGEGTHLNDFVSADDTVVVRYHEADGKKVAATIRVMEKAKK